MKALITVLAILVVVGLAFSLSRSPTAPPEITEAERAQYEADVRQQLTSLADSYEDALLRGDAGAFMSFYTPDTRVYYPGMNFDREELRAYTEESFRTTTYTGFDAKLVDLFVHGDAAYAIWEVSEAFQMERQEPETTISNCFSRFLKEEGAWKLDRDVCGPRDAPAEG